MNKDFERFFRENFPSVYIFMKHYTGDDELARDLTQETFMRVFERRESVELGEDGRAYLYTIARRLYWHHCRHKEVEDEYLAHLDENEADDYDFLREVTQRETMRVLYAAIDRLPSRARQVIQLSLEGKSNSEVAECMQISLNTVKDLKKSAYIRLRGLLSRNYLLLLFLLVEK